MAAVRELLRRSEPGDGGRVVDGEPLTCERLKVAATHAFDERGCRGDELIVAHGPQAASGHDQGSGRVANDDVLVCDFFPRHISSGCFSDMTRTFAVGVVDPEIAGWHAQCREALDLAVSLTRPGLDGKDLHAAVDGFFAERGHPTSLTKPAGTVLRDGFFHATGHGVGLDVHESPNIGRTGHVFVAGDVIALEPGLYRYGFGGVRIEDLVLVTDDGCEVLTDFPYDLVPARSRIRRPRCARGGKKRRWIAARRSTSCSTRSAATLRRRSSPRRRTPSRTSTSVSSTSSGRRRAASG